MRAASSRGGRPWICLNRRESCLAPAKRFRLESTSEGRRFEANIIPRHRRWPARGLGPASRRRFSEVLSYEGHDVIASTATTALPIAPDTVDPRSVPKRTLYTGAKIPVLGLGTFGSDRFTGEQIAGAVLGAASVGYRHFDCASVYGNEQQIGHSLRAIVDGGIAREDLWVTSNLWNDKHGEADVIPSCEQSPRDLQLDYLDLYLVHWPFPNYHPPGCDVGSRSKDARPYLQDNFMKTWRQMEALVDRGLVRHIGTSNMTMAKLKLMLRDARIKPACNEKEGQSNIGFWDKSDESGSWKVKFKQPGKYKVTASVAAISGDALAIVEVAGGTVELKPSATGSWDKFSEIEAPTIEVSHPEEQTVKVRPRDAQTWRPINLRWVKLSHVGS